MIEALKQRKDSLYAAADEALQNWYGHLPDDCEMRVVASQAIRQLVQYFSDRETDKFYEALDGSKDFLEKLRAVLNPLNPSWLNPEGGTTLYKKGFYIDRLLDDEKAENPEGWMSFVDRKFGSEGDSGSELRLLALLEKGEESHLFWPIDDLGYTCNEYLRRPWIQCGRIDMLLVRTMIYQQVLDLGKSLTNASLNWYTKAYRKRERNAVALTVLRLFVVGVVGLGAASAYGWWMGFIAGLGFIVLFDEAYKRSNSESRVDRLGILTRLGDMHRALLLTHKKELSTVLLRERLAVMDGGKGENLPDGIFSILDSAISRGAVLWGVD